MSKPIVLNKTPYTWTQTQEIPALNMRSLLGFPRYERNSINFWKTEMIRASKFLESSARGSRYGFDNTKAAQYFSQMGATDCSYKFKMNPYLINNEFVESLDNQTPLIGLRIQPNSEYLNEVLRVPEYNTYLLKAYMTGYKNCAESLKAGSLLQGGGSFDFTCDGCKRGGDQDLFYGTGNKSKCVILVHSSLFKGRYTSYGSVIVSSSKLKKCLEVPLKQNTKSPNAASKIFCCDCTFQGHTRMKEFTDAIQDSQREKQAIQKGQKKYMTCLENYGPLNKELPKRSV